ncbi:mannitol dehydrogenase family protein [Gynuella sunshinyii]|uniref:Mannitol-1-phosphate/altronate dehydrogenase n=1 Tax=Gynuella sunshinyii YC6258 TaxID=1445510 RepID=A0A0C5V9K3_9GAMM|nr:fructuronate reductase [Gynuella sunshinyii]AJQ96045.1 mannitol-1-phosphate/altronate dehydrogenase [Gynuella sunshinyii YC6258]
MNNIATATLNQQVKTPGYDRNRLTTKIVHFGFGAFHRAHQALYTDDVANLSGSDWGICEVSLMGNGELIKSLRAQDHLYSVLEKGTHGSDAKIVGVVTESIHVLSDGMDALLAKLAEPQIAIASMTITEKGYCVDASGKLDTANPMIAQDLKTPSAPQSAIAVIVEALRLRKAAQLPPFTVLSCDNMQENGKTARQAILQFANLIDPELGNWISTHVSFPCTMVDRIVPAATADTLDEIAEVIGASDPCGIACEPFRQWVIEDNFVAGRPDWNLAGAEFVDDVVPYEEMKLRMLNGAHSFLAYLGHLAGYEHISDTMADPHFKQTALKLMLETQAPSLTMPAGTDLNQYANSLIERFSNPSLKHRTWQIAMDGSQKIPQRFGGSLRYHLNQGSDFSLLALGIAGWIKYVGGQDDQGRAIDVKDPRAQELQQIITSHQDAADIVKHLLAIESIFAADIGQHPEVLTRVTAYYQQLLQQGARKTVAAL